MTEGQQAVVSDGQAHRRYVNSLGEEYKAMLGLRTEVYTDCDNPWREIRMDMLRRIVAKPFYRPLFERLVADINRINEMEEYEREHGISLADYSVFTEDIG